MKCLFKRSFGLVKIQSPKGVLRVFLEPQSAGCERERAQSTPRNGSSTEFFLSSFGILLPFFHLRPPSLPRPDESTMPFHWGGAGGEGGREEGADWDNKMTVPLPSSKSLANPPPDRTLLWAALHIQKPSAPSTLIAEATQRTARH